MSDEEAKKPSSWRRPLVIRQQQDETRAPADGPLPGQDSAQRGPADLMGLCPRRRIAGEEGGPRGQRFHFWEKFLTDFKGAGGKAPG